MSKACASLQPHWCCFSITSNNIAAPLFHEIMQIGPGLSGVVIFFCVSGYVVPMSVRGRIDPLNFMIRRIFRVYPLMLAAFIFLFVAGSAGILAKWSFMADATAYQWLANILLLQEYVGAKPILGVTWTLAVEFVWYGLFALSLWRFGDRAGRILNFALPLVILALTVASLVLGERLPLGRVNMIYACVLGYQAYLLDSGKISLRTLGVSIIAFLAVTIMSNLVAFGFYHHPQISLWQALMEIVPQDKELVVKAQLSAENAQDLHVGSKVRVRFPTIHDRGRPEVTGSITTISADALTDDRTGIRYFSAEARVPRSEIESITDGAKHGTKIHAGMPVEMLATLRKRTVLDYLLEPLISMFWRTGREH